MIEGVEKFGPELHGALLIQPEGLRQIEIEIDVIRPTHHSDACRAESLRRRVECRKCIGIEPALNRPLRRWKHRVANQIGPGLPFASQVENRAAAEGSRQPETALKGVDARELPASQYGVRYSAPRLSKAPAAAEGQRLLDPSDSEE